MHHARHIAFSEGLLDGYDCRIKAIIYLQLCLSSSVLIYMPLSARFWSNLISFALQRSGRIFLFRIRFQLLDLLWGC